MSRKLLPVSITAVLLGGTAMADVPVVAADIAPVHSLVSMVMEGVGSPKLIVATGASPHEYNLRPSEAAALQDADLVFWMGEGLTPWMEDAIETLATNADVTELLKSDEITLLEMREDALFEAHDHGHDDVHADEDHDHDDHAKHDEDTEHAHGDEHDDHDDHDHDNHDEEEAHAHDDHDDHEDHDHKDHDHDDHAGHDHGAFDPHAWLSPDNASTWLNQIAAQLSAADPDNAGTYFANAQSAREAMDALTVEVAETLKPVRGGSFVVFHDAYQYFENAFDFPASGAISLSDASDPSPARIAEIQGRIREEGVDCVLAEPQFNQGIVATVLGDTDANTGVIDPLGAALEPGAELYPQLIRNMAGTLADCL